MIVPDISVVLPISERADDLNEVIAHIRSGFSSVEKSYEILLIVDGDMPQRLEAARNVAQGKDDIRVLRFARRFGEGAALQAGLAASRAPILVTHPAYFEVASDVLPKLVAAIEDDADLSFASRQSEHETVFNRLQRGTFNVLIRGLLGIDERDVSCGVRAMRRETLEEISTHGAFHRFITVAAIMNGFVVKGIDAPIHEKARHSRAYSPLTYLRRVLDIANVFFVTKFLHKPLRFFGVAGALLFLPGFLICLYMSAMRLFASGYALGDRPLFLFGVILAVLGFQMLAIGLLGEIISFSQARKKKPYAIREVVRKQAGADAPASSQRSDVANTNK